ncbi:hypothetical protein EVAR_93969_1 [Eumeta japonica]|uniref:Uncharacterized protein n=1 Tax=Eumeta variegata TaxID=151549 RepID=A0A4C1TP89_EUMVA|nr:hypothetical protein EVAR_93969_1 [Eumeta japonica]
MTANGLTAVEPRCGRFGRSTKLCRRDRLEQVKENIQKSSISLNPVPFSIPVPALAQIDDERVLLGVFLSHSPVVSPFIRARATIIAPKVYFKNLRKIVIGHTVKGVLGILRERTGMNRERGGGRWAGRPARHTPRARSVREHSHATTRSRRLFNLKCVI